MKKQGGNKVDVMQQRYLDGLQMESEWIHCQHFKTFGDKHDPSATAFSAYITPVLINGKDVIA